MKIVIKWTLLLLAGAIITALMLYGTANAQELQPIPAPARVIDQTGTLTEAQKKQLTEHLLAQKSRADAVIVVVIIPTTKPEDTFSYAQRLFDAWSIGVKGKDNGVLILVAKDDRKVRLHTGYGAEGPIPDAVAKRITDAMAAKFKEGDFYGGVTLGVNEVANRMAGEVRTSQQLHRYVQVQGGEQRNDSVFIGLAWAFGLFFMLGLSGFALVQWFARIEEKARRAAEEERAREEAPAALQAKNEVPPRSSYAPVAVAATVAAVLTSEELERRRREDERRRKAESEESEHRRRRDEEERKRREDEDRRRRDEDQRRRDDSWSSSSFSSSSSSDSSSSWSSSDSGGSSGGGGSYSSW